MNFFKLNFCFVFILSFSLSANALNLTEAGQSPMDPNDNSWFAHAGIKRAGFAGDSSFTYIMNHDLSTGIQLVISDNDSAVVLEEFYEDTHPKDIRVYPTEDYIFIYHEEPGQLNSKYFDIYNLSTGQKIKRVSKLDIKNYFFNPEKSKLYFTSFEKNYVEDLISGTQSSTDYDSNSLRAFQTSKGLFFVERKVGVSNGSVFDGNMNKLYDIADPHQIYLRPLRFDVTVKDGRYLVISNREESKLISLYDLQDGIELLNDTSGDISISKSTEGADALAFYHEASKLVSFLDFNSDSMTKKDMGYQYIFNSVIDPATQNIRFWTFPQNKIVDVDFESLKSDSVDFKCQNHTFSANAVFVGCIENDKVKWWAFN